MTTLHGTLETLTALMGFVVLSLAYKIFRAETFLAYRRVGFLLVGGTIVFFASEFYALLDLVLPAIDREMIRALSRLGYVSSSAAALYLLLKSTQLEISSLRRAVDLDAVTQVHTIDAFRRIVRLRVARAWERRIALALLILDMDDFKSYNDAYGHEAGTLAIQRVAQVLRDVVRAREDVLARYGGDEFVALVVASQEDALALAERIRCEVALRCSPDHDSALQRPITISVGVSTLGDQRNTLEKLLEAADAELYRAKREGKDRVSPTQPRVANPA